MPEYPGGEKKMMQYLAMNLRYPAEAQKNDQQGTTIVQFVVNTQGKVEKAKVLRSISSILDQEALRVVNAMSEWVPGEQNGKKVSVYYTLPIMFKLDGSSKPAPSSANPSIVIVGYGKQTSEPVAAKVKELDPNNPPLYIVDGKEVDESTFKGLKPDNIKEISVLKDKSGTAIYGDKGKNGVIVITLKK